MDDEDIELLATAFQSAPDALALVRDDGCYTHCNAAAAELVGLSEDEVCDRRFGDFSRGPTRLRAKEWWSQLRKGRLAARHVVTGADGREHLVETRGRANVRPGHHLIALRVFGPHGAERNCVLSSREREVLSLLAAGYSTEEAAAQLILSPLTVRTHVRNAMDKLGARSRTHAVALALRDGEIAV